MQLICPRCHTNNRFGEDRPAAPARFVCVGCREEFDAVLDGGALRTVLPEEAQGLVPFEPAAPESDEDFFDILSIPQEPPAQAVAVAAPAQVLEDLFAAEPTAPEAVSAPSNEVAAALAAEVDPYHVTEPAERPAAPSHAQSARADAAPAVAAPAEASSPGCVQPPPSVDKYAVGMRVLRVSPAWLLLSSLGFFAVLLTLSWVSQPVGPVVEAVAAAGVKMPNQATSPPLKGAPEAPAGVEQAKATVEKALPPAPEKPAVAPAKAPAPQPEAPASFEGAGGGNYTVQVGSFNDPSEANQHVSRMRAAGFAARAVAVELPKRGTWYRVQSGRFETREEAAKAGAQMRAKGAAAAAIVTEVGAK